MNTPHHLFKQGKTAGRSDQYLVPIDGDGTPVSESAASDWEWMTAEEVSQRFEIHQWLSSLPRTNDR